MLASANTGYSTTGRGTTTGAAPGADDVDIAELERRFRDFSGAKRDEIEEMRVARHYYHSDQLTAEQQRILKKRRQPIVVANRIKRKINAVVGLVERLRTDPKAYPRTPRQEEGAELGTATINYACDKAKWKARSSTAVLKCAMEGLSGVALVVEPSSRGGYEIGLTVIDADTFFYDPRSFEPDFSDSPDMGEAKWYDLTIAQEMFPDHSEALETMVGTSGPLESWQQRDRETKWVDSTAKRVFIVEHWYLKRGEWHCCIYTKNLKLWSGPSYLRDEDGKTICRYIPWSAFVDHDGDRYGFIRDMRWTQDEINARRSKMLHAANARQVIANKDALGESPDIERLRTEVARPDGFVLVNGGPDSRFEIDKNTIDVQHQAMLLEQNYAEIENFGPNPVLIGEEGRKNQSGRAIALLQQAGMAELGPFMSNLTEWKLRVYRALWNAVQQYWTAEMWVRVTDDEGLAQFIQLNGVGFDQWGRPAMINALGELDVDIILEEGPDHVSLMEDVFETLSELARQGAPIPPDIIIEASNIPSSKKKVILDRLRNQQPSPEEQKAAALQLEDMSAKIEETRSKTAKNMAQAMDTARGQPQKSEKDDSLAEFAKALLADAQAELTRSKTELTDAQADHQRMETLLLPAERLAPEKQTASVSV